MINFNGNILAAVDVETTGREAGYHEIIQICVLPLNSISLDPQGRPFYITIKPNHLDRVEKKAMQKNGLDIQTILDTSPSQETAADYLRDWVRSLGLGVGKRLMPLTQNGEFDISHIKAWLGLDLYFELFSTKIRDLMYTATYLNDKAAWNCQAIPFPEVGLNLICEKLGIELTNHHDALADCIATAKCYRELLRMP